MTTEQMKNLQQKTREIKNPGLLDIIRKMKAKQPEPPTPEENETYINELLKARFIVPVAFGKEDSENPNKFQVQFSHIANKKKEKYFMAFTDMETLLKTAKDDEKLTVLGLTYNDFANMLADPKCSMVGFAVNPFTENIVCGAQQAQVIKQYITAKKVQSGELTVINELTGIPEEVTGTIEKYFDGRGDVKKAYLLGMRKADKHYRLVVVDTEESVTDFPAFAKEFGETILKPLNDERVPFMIMSFAEKAAKQATKEKVPFYVKV